MNRMSMTVLFALSAALFLGCSTSEPETDETPATGTLYDGARLVLGNGEVIDSGAFVVEGGRITAVGSSGELSGASTVDLSGKTVMPAIIDAHTHPRSDRDGLIEDLERRAYQGISATTSYGLDGDGAALEVRGETHPGAAQYRSAGRGITMPEPGRSEVPHWVTTEEEARQAVRDEVARGVDLIKIWVDDRGGQYDKLTPELYGAVIDEAHQNNLRVSAHVFYLEDAKGLLRAGIDVFAHGIRDQDIDDELVELVKERPNVVLIPNMPYRGVPTNLDWLDGYMSSDQLSEAKASMTERPDAAERFAIQARNLKRLSDEGMTIAFGTDGNTPWAPHVEMEDMVASGMAPGDVIVAATANAAAVGGFPDLGTIEVGKSADFLVLGANPLEDITNTRRIESVYLRGDEVDREALASGFRSTGGE